MNLIDPSGENFGVIGGAAVVVAGIGVLIGNSGSIIAAYCANNPEGCRRLNPWEKGPPPPPEAPTCNPAFQTCAPNMCPGNPF